MLTNEQQTIVNNALARFEDLVANQFLTRQMFLEGVLEKRAKIDSSCGYVPMGGQIPIDDLRNMYDRFAPANRVVALWPKECWQVQPQVLENEEKTKTEFEQAWIDVCNSLQRSNTGGVNYYQDERGSGMWEYLSRGDELSGIGTFGIVLLGLADGKLLEQPVTGSPPDGNPFTVPNVDSGGPGLITRSEQLIGGPFGAQAGTYNPGVMGGQGVQQTYQNIYGNPQSEVTPETSMMDEYASTSRDIYGGATQNPLSSTIGTDAQYRGIQFTPGFYPSGDPYGPINPYAMPNMPPKRGMNGTGKHGRSKNGQGKNGQQQANPNKLLFLRVFDEALVQVVQYEADLRNPRFGQPIMYLVTLNDPRYPHTGIGLPLATLRVHWSRVIHLADSIKSSEIFGLPRMKPVFNRLIDLRKLYGGSAEMYWQGALPGISFETHPQLGGDVNLDIPGMQDMIRKYMEGLQRYIQLSGVTARTLAPTVVDPSNQINTQLQAICIQLGVPMRVFLGSERGELASSQDDAAWNDRLRHRQNTYLTPRVICPMVNRLIMLGIIPPPKGYSVKWPDLDSQTDAAKAGIAAQKTQALTTFTGGNPESIMTPVRYYMDILGYDQEKAEQVVAEALAAQQAAQMATTYSGEIESPARQQEQAQQQETETSQRSEAKNDKESKQESKKRDSEHKRKKNSDQQKTHNSIVVNSEKGYITVRRDRGERHDPDVSRYDVKTIHVNPTEVEMARLLKGSEYKRGKGLKTKEGDHYFWVDDSPSLHHDTAIPYIEQRTNKKLDSRGHLRTWHDLEGRGGSVRTIHEKSEHNQSQPIAAGLAVRAKDTGRVLLIQRALLENVTNAGETSSLSSSQLERELGSGELHKMATNSGGFASSNYKLLTRGGANGIYKPVGGHKAMGFPIPRDSEHKRAVAYYRVAKHLGMSDIVPATTLRLEYGMLLHHLKSGRLGEEGYNADNPQHKKYYTKNPPTQLGSVMHHIEEADHPLNVKPRHMFGTDKDLRRAAFLDYLMGHMDRHEGNWGITHSEAGHKIHLWDNDYVLPSSYKGTYNSHGGEEIPNMMVEEAADRRHKLPVEGINPHWQQWHPIEHILSHSGIDEAAIERAKYRHHVLSEAHNTGRTFTNLPNFAKLARHHGDPEY